MTRHEERIATILDLLGIEYEVQAPLPGTPDFLIGSTAIFCNGCFWHSHGCRKAARTNPEFWRHKLAINKARDERVTKELQALRYDVLILWECEKWADLREKLARWRQEGAGVLSSVHV